MLFEFKWIRIRAIPHETLLIVLSHERINENIRPQIPRYMCFGNLQECLTVPNYKSL
jgi:hypothetical protein